MAGSNSSGGCLKSWTNRLLVIIALLLFTIVFQNTHNVVVNQTEETVTKDKSLLFSSSSLRGDSVLSTALATPPEPLPSIRVSTNPDDIVMKLRDGKTKYGGKGDKQHLGKSVLSYISTII